MTKQERKYLLLITVIFIAACIETDIYLPAFPDMMHYFGVSEEAIQSVLTWNFIGICLSGPIYGPISDSIGRKKPLCIALGLFLLGSILTIVSDSFTIMLLGRLLQGLGSGGCFTLGTAIIFDAFKAEKASLALNKLNSIIPFIMSAAPMLGGYLNLTFGFRSNFLAIALFVLASLVICFLFLEETLAKEKMAPLNAKKIVGDFTTALTNVPFWQMTFIVSLMFAGYLTFLSGTAVLFVVEFGVSKSLFPLYQAAILLAWLAANFCFTPLVRKIGIPKVKIAGISLVVAGGLWLLIAAWLSPTNASVLTSGMLIYTFGANWINGIYFPEGMELLPDIKGATSSLLTSARLLITACVVGITSHFYDGSIFPTMIAIVGSVIVILPLTLLYEKRRQKAINRI